MSRDEQIRCERCGLHFPKDNIVDVDGKDGWGELCEDCSDTLVWDDEG